MYTELHSLENILAEGRELSLADGKSCGGSSFLTLHLDFVAKPTGNRDLATDVASALEDAQMGDKGLQAAMLLISDREARLVTLLTFWERARFLAGREQRVAWMQKLLAPFADGSVRAQTSVPRILRMYGGEFATAAKQRQFGDPRFSEVAAE